MPKQIGLYVFLVLAPIFFAYFSLSEAVNIWLGVPADMPGPLGVIAIVGTIALFVWVVWYLAKEWGVFERKDSSQHKS